MKEKSKYYPLFAHLQQQSAAEITLTFTEIETLLRAKLPGSARRSAAWWSNRTQGAVQADAWMEAGYRVTAVDVDAATVTLRPLQLQYEARRVGGSVVWTGELIQGLRQHMGLTQKGLADELGVRQQTISEWEQGAYQPSRSTSRYLTLVAEQNGFTYTVRADEPAEFDSQ